MPRNYEHKRREYTKIPCDCLSMFKLIDHEMGGLIMDLLDDYNQALLESVDAPIPNDDRLDAHAKIVFKRLCSVVKDDAKSYEYKCETNAINRKKGKDKTPKDDGAESG